MKCIEEILIDNLKKIPKHKQGLDPDVWGAVVEAMEELEKQVKNCSIPPVIGFSAEKVEEAYDNGRWDKEMNRAKIFDIEYYR